MLQELIRDAYFTKSDLAVQVLSTNNLKVLKNPLESFEQESIQLVHSCSRLKDRDTGRRDYVYLYIQCRCSKSTKCSVKYKFTIFKKTSRYRALY